MALVVMAKVPRPRLVKTRLVPPLTYEEAALLSVAFLQDTLSAARLVAAQTNTRGLVAYAPADAGEELAGFLPDKFATLPQQGADLGERLRNLTEKLFTSGYRGLCVIGTDAPALPPAILGQAIAWLREPGDRLVLGPADDGGYYLIGLKKQHLRLFEEISWSSPAVFAQTEARARELSLPVAILPSWYDVDDANALRRLCREIHAGDTALHTRLYLQELQAAGRLRGLFQEKQPSCF